MSCEMIELFAPAKVNLILKVEGRRHDGYHELTMLMAPVSVYDRLTLTKLPPGQIEVEVEGATSAGLPTGEENLCHRAANFYFKTKNIDGGVRIALSKSIPSGAGMGGGSSDAATTIMGLEELYGEKLDGAQRAAAAFDVGADVSFFFARSPAWVEGIGERLRPVGFEQKVWMVIIHPGAFLSTAAVFSSLNMRLTTGGGDPTIGQFDFGGIAKALANDLEPAALKLEPAIAGALDALKRSGAAASLMTGSGSAVFGLFPDEEGARKAREEIAASAPEGWWIEAASTL